MMQFFHGVKFVATLENVSFCFIIVALLIVVVLGAGPVAGYLSKRRAEKELESYDNKDD